MTEHERAQHSAGVAMIPPSPMPMPMGKTRMLCQDLRAIPCTAASTCTGAKPSWGRRRLTCAFGLQAAGRIERGQSRHCFFSLLRNLPNFALRKKARLEHCHALIACCCSIHSLFHLHPFPPTLPLHLLRPPFSFLHPPSTASSPRRRRPRSTRRVVFSTCRQRSAAGFLFSPH